MRSSKPTNPIPTLHLGKLAPGRGSLLDIAPFSYKVTATSGHQVPPNTRATQMKLLTILEVAEAIKVSEKTVRRLIKSGDLTAYKVGERGQLRVKDQDLEHYVEAQRVRVEETTNQDGEVAETNE